MTVKRRKIEKLPCSFCQEKKTIDYKDVETLKPFLTDYGRIVPRYVSGYQLCFFKVRRMIVIGSCFQRAKIR